MREHLCMRGFFVYFFTVINIVLYQHNNDNKSNEASRLSHLL